MPTHMQADTVLHLSIGLPIGTHLVSVATEWHSLVVRLVRATLTQYCKRCLIAATRVAAAIAAAAAASAAVAASAAAAVVANLEATSSLSNGVQCERAAMA